MKTYKTYTLVFMVEGLPFYTVDICTDKDPQYTVNSVLKSKIFHTKVLDDKAKVKRVLKKDIAMNEPRYYWQVIDNSNGREYYYV